MNKQTDEAVAEALVRIATFLDKSDPPSALEEAGKRNAALMNDPGYIRRQQQEMQRAEAERRRRADAELGAIGHQPGYAPNTPGQSALDRAMRALHQPTAQQAAPAPKTMERRAAPAVRGPINSLVSGRSAETLIQRATRAGGTRLPSFNGRKCSTPRCSNYAAWTTSTGQPLCNACAEKTFPKKAAR